MQSPSRSVSGRGGADVGMNDQPESLQGPARRGEDGRRALRYQMHKTTHLPSADLYYFYNTSQGVEISLYIRVPAGRKKAIDVGAGAWQGRGTRGGGYSGGKESLREARTDRHNVGVKVGVGNIGLMHYAPALLTSTPPLQLHRSSCNMCRCSLARNRLQPTSTSSDIAPTYPSLELLLPRLAHAKLPLGLSHSLVRTLVPYPKHSSTPLVGSA
ncbi:unnamed protein product [Cyclocybe aegerita]|uniref:Uncharacterized protein n=1 Tax=Cyclocybe aegerita TaxID=1973307 RepID=A0A8S0WGK2_CYCAE|nr:unnamed protein product [Cyclocybe aegerita]